MALSATVLRDLIDTKLAAKIGDAYTSISAEMKAGLLEAIAEAVVDHIKAAGIVTVPSVSGVTAGAGTSGPGTGTIT